MSVINDTSKEEAKKARRASEANATRLAVQAHAQESLQEELRFVTKRAQEGAKTASQLHEKASALHDDKTKLQNKLEAAQQLAAEQEQIDYNRLEPSRKNRHTPL